MASVAIFADHFHPFAGGLELYALSLARELSKKHTVHVFTYLLANTPTYEVFEGIHIHRMQSKEILKNTFRLPTFWSGDLKNLKIRLSQLKITTIITNTRFFSTSWIGTILAKKLRVHHIHVEHGNKYVTHNNPFITACAWIVDQTFGRFVLTSAAKVVVISDPGIRFVKKLGVKNTQKIVKIPNCIDMSRFVQVNPIQLSDKPVVLYVGRLIYAKGVHHLIDAMKTFPQLQLVIVGDGPYREQLEREAEGFALFVGSKPVTEIPRYMASASVFVNPSYSEGLPTSVIEAGACALPVIATDVGGTKEIIPSKKYGWLITPKSTQAIVQALTEAIAPGAHKRAKALRTYVQKRFDVSVLRKEFGKLIK